MRQLEVAPSTLKVGVVLAAERLGRLKPNGTLFKRSPLSEVLELEALVVGIAGKEALWTALRAAGVGLDQIDLDALIHSAQAQRREVDELRLAAAAKTFEHSERAALNTRSQCETPTVARRQLDESPSAED